MAAQIENFIAQLTYYTYDVLPAEQGIYPETVSGLKSIVHSLLGGW